MRVREKLTLESVQVRTVAVPMRRPTVSKVGTYPEWPFILIDVRTKKGVVGTSYLAPYLKKAIRYVGRLRTYDTNGLWPLPPERLAKEAEELEVKERLVTVPDRAGNGIGWNEDAVRKFAYQA